MRFLFLQSEQFLIVSVFSFFIFLLTQTSGVRALEQMNSEELRNVDAQQGLNLQFTLNANADFLELTDPQGTTLGPGSGTAGALRLGNFSLSNGSSGNFTTVTVDADGSDGLAFEIPSSEVGFDLVADRLTFPDDPTSNSLDGSFDAGTLNVGNIDVTGSYVTLSGAGEGIDLEGEINASADHIIYDDADANAKFLLENPRISDFGSGGSYDFSGLSLDFDANGIAITPPSESFSLDSTGVCIEDFAQTTCSDEDYIVQDLEIDDLGVGGSSFFVRGTDGGLELDGELTFTIDEVTLADDGTPNNSTGGTVNFHTIRFTDASSGVGAGGGGGAVPFDFDEPALHVDGNDGIFLELPGFDTGGSSFDSPANELFIQNINVGHSCFSGCGGNWSIRNLDMGGSWVNVSGRN